MSHFLIHKIISVQLWAIISLKVSICNCKFNDLSVKSEEGNGGAINVAYCVINMEQSEFIHYTSSTDGGGCIYANLDKQIEDEFKIENCKLMAAVFICTRKIFSVKFSIFN